MSTAAGRQGWRDVVTALRLLLGPAAAGLALVTLFALSARAWWAFDLFSHFRLQYLATALVLLGVALALRSWPAAVVLAGIALVHGSAVRNLWPGSAADPSPGGIALRVAAANVRNGNSTPEKVVDFVRTQDLDLVLLIDAKRDAWGEVLQEMGEIYPHRAPQGWRGGGRLALFSRHPIVEGEVVRQAAGDRPLLVAEIALGGRTLELVGVHPSSPSPREGYESHSRNRQLDGIARRVDGADRPVIVAGDLNTSPWSPHFEDLLASAGLHNAAAGHGFIATWPEWLGPARIPIDHILIKGQLAATDVRRGPDIGSDHFPIIADLRLSGG